MIDEAVIRQHLKLDDDDIEDDLLAQYIASGVSTCESYCNRKFYADELERTTDRAQAWTDMLDAVTERNDAMADPANSSCEAQQMITDEYIVTWSAITRRRVGIVVDDTIRAAILMTIGHFYRNRQNVVVGVSVAQMPEGAMRILEPYLWIGDLAGGPQ